MASDQSESAAQPQADLEDAEELRRLLDENAEQLSELLATLEAVQGLSADLAPELRRAVHENRDDLRDLRMALEREETLIVLQRLGHQSETLVALLDQLEVAEGIASDLAPEIRRAVAENRDVIRNLRSALENEDLVVLLERLGENADDLAELLELVEVAKGLAEDLAPEMQAVATAERSTIRDLRQITAGMADAYDDTEVEPYTFGRNLGNAMTFAQKVGDPATMDTLDAGLSALTEEEPPERVGLFGLFGALRDDDVQRGLGRLVEAIRRIGRT